MIGKIILCCAASAVWCWLAAEAMVLLPHIDEIAVLYLFLAFVIGPGVVWFYTAKLVKLL